MPIVINCFAAANFTKDETVTEYGASNSCKIQCEWELINGVG